MMLYRNTKNGAVIDTPCEIRGKDWEVVETPDLEPEVEVNDEPEEELEVEPEVEPEPKSAAKSKKATAKEG